MDIEARVRWLNEQPTVQNIWRYLDEVLVDIVAEAILIQQIAAPTFKELVRANHVLSRFGACGLNETAIDSLYNAFGRIPGTDPALPGLLVSAHTDTVFTEDADLTIHHQDGRIYGPGLGDNSLGVAGLIALADVIRQFQISPPRDLWLLANSREEGLGDLGGIRAFHDEHQDQIGTAIVLEGMALGQVYHVGIAVRRLHVTCQAPGGHSWQHFGRPSAIHSLLRLGARLTELEVPENPRTTYNIGLVDGGHSVNSLATEAGFFLDLRSVEAESLARLENQVRAIIAEHQRCEDVTFEIEVVGDRPSGRINLNHDLVRATVATLQQVDLQANFRAGSTDANLLLSRGLPTVTIGMTYGDNAHRLDEYIEIEPVRSGMRQLILLVLAMSEWEPPT